MSKRMTGRRQPHSSDLFSRESRQRRPGRARGRFSPSASPPQGTPADVLYKGTITRLITEEGPVRGERGEGLSKGHVVYEGVSGHILTYDREWPPEDSRLQAYWSGLC